MSIIDGFLSKLRTKELAEQTEKHNRDLTYAQLILRSIEDGKLSKAEQAALEDAALARGITAEQLARDVHLGERIVQQLKACRELPQRLAAYEAASRRLAECNAERQRLWQEQEEKGRAANTAAGNARAMLDESHAAKRILGELTAGTVFAEAAKL